MFRLLSTTYKMLIIKTNNFSQVKVPRSLVKTFFLRRVRRICSTDAKFTLSFNRLRTYVIARGYDDTFL